MNFDLILKHWDLFAWGVLTTLELTAIALAVGFVIAVPSALSMTRPTRWTPFVRAYVYVFRGTPLLVQTYLIYYGLAQFDVVRSSFVWPVLREAWWCAVIAFSLNSGAYAAEILRGAIQTMPKGELEGARALGLSERQVTWLVLIPSALRRALPQYGNEVVFMLHGTVVASVITIQDILGVGRTVNAKYYISYEGLLTAAALYMIITYITVRLFRLVEEKYLKHLNLDAGRKQRAGVIQAGIPAMR